jgi:hypothetical protein
MMYGFIVFLSIETVYYIKITIVEAHSNIFTAPAQTWDLHSRGAEPGIEPRPAAQQADALLFELHRTL